jgi:hypothetical protein
MPIVLLRSQFSTGSHSGAAGARVEYYGSIPIAGDSRRIGLVIFLEGLVEIEVRQLRITDTVHNILRSLIRLPQF